MAITDFPDTFTDAMKKNPGDGSATGDGAYRKPAAVGAPHAGAVYVVAGNRGRRQNRRVAGPPGHGRFDQDSGVNGARREREPS